MTKLHLGLSILVLAGISSSAQALQEEEITLETRTTKILDLLTESSPSEAAKELCRVLEQDDLIDSPDADVYALVERAVAKRNDPALVRNKDARLFLARIYDPLISSVLAANRNAPSESEEQRSNDGSTSADSWCEWARSRVAPQLEQLLPALQAYIDCVTGLRREYMFAFGWEYRRPGEKDACWPEYHEYQQILATLNSLIAERDAYCNYAEAQ